MNQKQIVVHKYLFFTDATKGFNQSGLRMICPIHGFQQDVKVDHVNKNTDMFGFYTNYGSFCLQCGNLCKEEKARVSEERSYESEEWVN